MPNRIQQYQDMQEKLNNIIFGNPEDLDQKAKWYHYLNFAVKALTPIAAIYLLLIKSYVFAVVFFLCFVIDILFYFNMKKRYKLYKEIKNIMDKVK